MGGERGSCWLALAVLALPCSASCDRPLVTRLAVFTVSPRMSYDRRSVPSTAPATVPTCTPACTMAPSRTIDFTTNTTSPIVAATAL